MAEAELSALRDLSTGWDYDRMVHTTNDALRKAEQKLKARRITIRDKSEPHQMLLIKSSTLAKLAFQFFFGRFPSDKRILEVLHGRKYYDMRDELLALLQRTRWTEVQEKRVVQLLLRLTDHWDPPVRVRHHCRERQAGR